MTRNLLLIAFAILFALGCFLGFVFGAQSHEWYDHDCCNTKDCYMVQDDEVGESAKGEWKHFPTGATFKDEIGMKRIRPSKDSHFHVCISKYSRIGYCIYIVSGT